MLPPSVKPKQARQLWRSLVGALLLFLSGMPLPAQAADQMLLLEVQVNGNAIGKVGQFTLRDGLLLARGSEIRELGLRTPVFLDPNSDDLVALSILPGVSWRVDDKTQTLWVTSTHDGLLRTRLQNARPQDKQEVASGTGVTLNYDLVDTFAGLRNGASGSLDLRAFSPWGVANTGLLVFAGGDTGSSRKNTTVRLDSAYTYADSASMRRYTLGDFITGGLGWTRPVHLEGVQLRSDFSMRPDLVTFPLPSIRGSAAVPSTVDVLANGNYLLSQQITPGPFEVPQLPVLTGAGTISMTVTNALGQQVTVNQSFYASSTLLTPGLQTMSVQAGAVRRSWGSISNDYGKFAASGTYRRGLTPTVTLEGSAEGTGGVLMAGGGAAVNMFNLGVLNIAVAGSTGAGQPGDSLTFGLQRCGRRLSLGGSTTFASRNFRDIAAMNGDSVPRRQMNGNAGLSAARFGTIGVTYAGLDLISVSDPRTSPALRARHAGVFSGSYSVQFHRLSMYASDFYDVTEGRGGGVTFGVTVPFGRRGLVSVGLATDGRYRQAQAQQSVASIGDWGYQAYVSGGDQTHAFAQTQYKSPGALLSVGVDRTKQQTSVVFESQGALSLVDRGLFPSNTVDDSFAIVDTGGLGHVRVLQENREIGTTNTRGRLLVPDLRSFDINHIGIEPTDVPLDTTVDSTARQVRPQDRSGVVIRFPVKISHAALLQLVDETGIPVPTGSTGRLRAAGPAVPIGFEGAAYVQDLDLQNELAVDRADGFRCSVHFQYKPVPGDIPRIGPLLCVLEKD